MKESSYLQACVGHSLLTFCVSVALRSSSWNFLKLKLCLIRGWFWKFGSVCHERPNPHVPLIEALFSNKVVSYVKETSTTSEPVRSLRSSSTAQSRN